MSEPVRVCVSACVCVCARPHGGVGPAGRLGGGQRYGQQVGLGGEDVVVDVEGQLALLREQQVQVLEHLGQEEGVHAAGGGGELGVSVHPVSILSSIHLNL